MLKVKVKSLSCVQLVATSWTVAYQAPPPMGFSRQEYWSGVPLPSPTIVLSMDVSVGVEMEGKVETYRKLPFDHLNNGV